MKYIKVCTCKEFGVKVDTPKITAEEKNGVIKFTLSISMYHCPQCGKAWKQVEDIQGTA